MTRSPPVRSVDDQGEGLLLNSYDRTLVIKQISSEEVADMHSILSEYHQVRPEWLTIAVLSDMSKLVRGKELAFHTSKGYNI